MTFDCGGVFLATGALTFAVLAGATGAAAALGFSTLGAAGIATAGEAAFSAADPFQPAVCHTHLPSADCQCVELPTSRQLPGSRQPPERRGSNGITGATAAAGCNDLATNAKAWAASAKAEAMLNPAPPESAAQGATPADNLEDHATPNCQHVRAAASICTKMAAAAGSLDY